MSKAQAAITESQQFERAGPTINKMSLNPPESMGIKVGLIQEKRGLNFRLSNAGVVQDAERVFSKVT